MTRDIRVFITSHLHVKDNIGKSNYIRSMYRIGIITTIVVMIIILCTRAINVIR